jgi:hypothetical protein
MKKFLLISCFILAFPILFSGSPKVSNPGPAQVYAQSGGGCIENQQPGNAYCTDMKRKHLPKPTGSRHHEDLQPGSLGLGFAALVSVFMMWVGMRL